MARRSSVFLVVLIGSVAATLAQTGPYFTNVTTEVGLDSKPAFRISVGGASWFTPFSS